MTDEEDEIELVEFIRKVFEQYDYNGYYDLMIDTQAQSGLLNVTEEGNFLIFSPKKKELTDNGKEVNKKIEEILSSGKKNLLIGC